LGGGGGEVRERGELEGRRYERGGMKEMSVVRVVRVVKMVTVVKMVEVVEEKQKRKAEEVLTTTVAVG
jgi:hypothetical protein